MQPQDIDQFMIMELQNNPVIPDHKAKVDELLSLVIKYQELQIKSCKMNLPPEESGLEKYRKQKEQLVQKEQLLKEPEVMAQLKENDPQILQTLYAQIFDHKNSMMALEQKYKVAYNSLMQLILNQYQNENNTTNDINFDEKLQNAKVSQIKIEDA